MEECGEVIKAASKRIRFGHKENDYRLDEEIGDLLCIVESLERIGKLDNKTIEDSKLKKRIKLRKWSKLPKSLLS
tara:strand:- start:1145 stop:1369 length:225 start_codon:yes stop_codon:yes gene_type:complete